MENSSSAIGIFDSGVGGLTVMRQIMRILPAEQLIYYGDTARIPYGNKSGQTIIRYMEENTHFLLSKGIKALVIACNTATAFSLSAISKLSQIPILGVIEPGAEQAALATQNQRIAVLGTRGTILSGAYQEALRKAAPQSTLYPVACPLFVPLIEEQWLDHPATRLIIEEYLRPLRSHQVDTAILGCTHYPLLYSLIQNELGNGVKVIDSAIACANRLAAELKRNNLLALSLQGEHQYYVSDDPEKFRFLAEYLFGHPIANVSAKIDT